MKATDTRKHILEKAAPLFNKKGFRGTSLSDLEQVTGLTKGALYAHFRDKETLGAEAFAYAAGLVRSRFDDALRKKTTYKGKLIALLDSFSRYVLDPPLAGGCPLLNTAVEAADDRIDLRPVVGAEITGVVHAIETLLKKGVKAGEFHKGFNARELAYVFFCMVEGAIMFSRVERSRDPMNIVIKHCKHKLEQITCSKNA